MSFNQNEKIDLNFFIRKLTELKEIRDRFIDAKKTNSYRLVFGESPKTIGQP